MQGDQVTPASAWAATSTAETPTVATESRGDSARSLVWEIIQTVLLTIAIFLAVRSVVQNFRVEGSSMETNLHTGQYIIVNRIEYLHLDLNFFQRLLPGKQDLAPKLAYLVHLPRRCTPP